jgi:phosphoglycerate dehydrogenase-like enzyme
VECDGAVRIGDFGWPGSEAPRRLRGLRLGLLGFGNIARIVARITAPFGLSTVAFDPYVSPDVMRDHGVEPADLEPLLATADILSVHVPWTPETHRLLNEARLALLPPAAIVVITSRGDVYDADALADAAARGRLSAVGLDVFPQEPLPRDHRLTRLPNVILTPHVAGYSRESIAEFHQGAAAVVAALARGKPPLGLVNPDMPYERSSVGKAGASGTC